MRRKIGLLSIAVICLILTATPCAAMFDAFLQLDGIKGESQDSQHKDWIQVLTYSHKVSPGIAPSFGTSASGLSSLPAHGDLYIAKLLDAATPKLREGALLGKRIKFANLDLVYNGQIYWRARLENVGIVNVQALTPDLLVWTPTLSNAPISASLQESVQLRYGKIAWSYMSPYGGGSSEGGYDSVRLRAAPY